MLVACWLRLAFASARLMRGACNGRVGAARLADGSPWVVSVAVVAPVTHGHPGAGLLGAPVMEEPTDS